MRAEEKDSLLSPSDKKIIVPKTDDQAYTFTVKGEGGAVIPAAKLGLSLTTADGSPFTVTPNTDYATKGAIKLAVGTLNDRTATNSIVVKAPGYAPVTIPVTVKQVMKVTKDGSEQNSNGVVTVTLSGTDASEYAITKSDASGAPELTNLAGTKSAGVDAKFTVERERRNSGVNDINSHQSPMSFYLQ